MIITIYIANTDKCMLCKHAVQHNSRGIVGMANSGYNTNSSQLYITLKAAPWMDTVYVAFAWVSVAM